MAKKKTALKWVQRRIADLGNKRKKMAIQAEQQLAWLIRKTLDRLIEATAHPDPQVRYRSAWVLGEIGHPKAYPILLELTRDPDEAVSYDAAVALGTLGDPRAIEPLIEIIRNQKDERAEILASAAAQGLHKLGKPAVPALIEILLNGSTEARITAAYTLGGIGDERALESLSALLDDAEERARIAGIEALGEIGQPGCLTLIRKGLHDPIAKVRETAAFWHQEVRTSLPKL